MSTLGEAFIDIRARSGAFKEDLSRQLKAVLTEAQAQADAASGSIAKSGIQAASSVAQAAETAGAAQVAENVKVADSAKNAAKAIVDAERRAYAEGERLAKEAAAAKIRADKEVAASAKETAATVEKASVDAQAAAVKGQRAIQQAYKLDAELAQRAARIANAATAAKLNASIDAAEATAAASRAATKAQEEDLDRLVLASRNAAKRIAAAETEAYAIAEAASKAATRAQEEDFDRWVASARAAAKRVAAAEVEAYAIVEAAAKQAAKVQAAESAKAAINARASAAKINGSFGAGFSSGFTKAIDNIPKKIGKAAAGIPKDIFSAVTTSAAFATVGVVALGAAIAGIGLKAAADLQSAQTAFEALSENIGATVDVTTESINALGKVQLTAAKLESGFDPASFLEALRSIAKESTLAFTTLSSTSQQLLSLDYNGRQARTILLTVGNALAASGKNGGQLNEDLRGVITAFAQIKGSGRLLAQDLNQITTRIPSATRVKVYEQLAKNLGLVKVEAKGTSKEMKAAVAEVRKLSENGEIGADLAVKSVLQVLRDVKGATKDGITALERQNTETLAGAFEGLKDTIRLNLGDAFLASADRITKKIPDITAALDSALSKLGPKLSTFVEGFFDLLAKPEFINALAGAIDSAFTLLTAGLQVAVAVLPVLLNGLAALYTAIQQIAIVGAPAFKAVGDAVGAIGEALPALATALGGALVFLGPILRVVAAVVKLVLAASPLLTGLGAGLALIGQFLDPIADKIVALAGFLQGLVEFIGPVLKIVGVIAAIAAGLAVLPALLFVIAGAVAALTAPVSLVIIGVVALIAAFKKFQLVRDLVTGVFRGIAEAAALYLTVPLHILQILIDALGAAAKHVPFVGKALGGSFDKASDAIGGAIDKINGAVDAIDNLRNVGKDATDSLSSNIQASASSIAEFNLAIHGTGTAALDASTTVGELDKAIDNLPLSKRIKILVSIGQENIDFAQQNGIPLTGLEDATGFSNAGIEAVNQQIRDDAKKAALEIGDNLGNVLNGVNDAVNSKADEAAKKAAEAAKKRADTFKQAIKDIIKSLDSDFRNTLVNGTRKQIDSALDGLARKIAAVYKAAGKARPDALIKRIDKDNATLKDLADKRDAVLDKLAKATARFEEVRDSIKSFGAITALGLEGIASAAGKAKTALADLSRLRIILPGQDTLNVITPGAAAKAALKASAKEFADALKLRLKLIQEFQANIAKLIAKGLNKQTIDEIISAGPEAGGGIANSLAAASKATIDSINDSQKAIAKAGKELGNTAADSLFRAGKSVADGLIQGLKDKRDEIRDAMKDIANALIDQIKKVLKIKSPSQVMHAIGRHTGAGLHQGLTATSPAVAKAAAGLASAAVPSIAPMVMPAVPSIAAQSLPAPTIAPLSMPPMPEIAPLSLPVLPTIAPLSMPNLAKMAASQAQLELAGALALPPPPSRGTAAPVSTTTNHREIHAPITQHFNVPSTDPRAFAAHMNAAAAKAVR